MNFKENKTLISIIVIIFSIVLVGGGYLFVKKACVEDIKEKYREDIEALKEIADFEKIDCNPFSRSVEITNIKAKDGSFVIRRVEFSKFKEDKELKVPLSLRMRAEGVKTKDENGLTEGDIDILYNLDLEKKQMNLDIDISEKNEGIYNINILLGNIDRDTIKILNEVAKKNKLKGNENLNENLDFIMALGNISIERLHFEFENRGVLDKILEEDAKNRNMSVDELKEEMIADINKSLKEKNLSEDTRKFFIAFRDLIEGKRKKISFTIVKKGNTDTSLMKILSLIMISPDPLKEFNNMFKIEIN